MQLEQMKGKLAGQADENEMSKLKNNMVIFSQDPQNKPQHRK